MSQEIFTVVHRQHLNETGGANNLVRFLFATSDKEEAESFVAEANQKYKARLDLVWRYESLHRKDPRFLRAKVWDDHEQKEKEALKQMLLLDPMFDGVSRNTRMEYAVVPLTLKPFV